MLILYPISSRFSHGKANKSPVARRDRLKRRCTAGTLPLFQEDSQVSIPTRRLYKDESIYVSRGWRCWLIHLPVAPTCFTFYFALHSLYSIAFNKDNPRIPKEAASDSRDVRRFVHETELGVLHGKGSRAPALFPPHPGPSPSPSPFPVPLPASPRPPSPVPLTPTPRSL